MELSLCLVITLELASLETVLANTSLFFVFGLVFIRLTAGAGLASGASLKAEHVIGRAWCVD